MNDLRSSNFVVIRHQPLGEMHPYIPLPYERSPRNPTTREPVFLNLEVESYVASDSVCCKWSIAGEGGVHQTEALLITRERNLENWRISLPAFSGGETINYRFFVKKGNQKVESDNYTFDVSFWLDIVSYQVIKTSEEAIDLLCATQRDSLFVDLSLALDSAKNLRLTISPIRDYLVPVGNLQSTIIDWQDIQIAFQEQSCEFSIKRKSDGLAIKCTGPMQVLVNKEGSVLKYRLGFESPVDEAFYGFGERFNSLDQRGNHLDNHVYGQYTSQGKRTYIPIPFFISSRNYGVWLKTSRQAEFDLASARPDRLIIEGNAETNETLEMVWFFEQHPFEIIKSFTDLVGKPTVPPPWAFGLWMSSNDWNNQAEVLRQLNKTKDLQIPASVLVIEAWSDEITFYIWNDAQYRVHPSSKILSLRDYYFPSGGHWPDPKSMINEIHQQGLRLVLWQIPVLKAALPNENLDDSQNRTDRAYAIKKGFVVKKDDGSAHRVENHMPWFGNSLVLDFSNQEAADWWLAQRDYLVTELDVDGFKTDGGEHIWDVDTYFSNTKRGIDGINEYPLYYESAYYRFLQKYKNKSFVLFSRAGYTGSQMFPCHWAGDECSTWDAFRATVNAMLNAGISGIPFIGWDIAGFAGPIPTSDLYLRASAFSVFCPIMQYHSDVNNTERTSRDRTPWNIQKQTGDTQVVPTFRKLTNLRMNFLPYILNQVHISSITGIPLMRALALVYPHDINCRKYPNQYFFGEDLLVAPVTRESIEKWPVYLPEGDWRDLWTGQIQRGPCEIKVEVPYDIVPIFQKKSGILPLNLAQTGEFFTPTGNTCDHVDELTLLFFPGMDFQSEFFVMKHSKPFWFDVKTHHEVGISIQFSRVPVNLRVVISSVEPVSIYLNDVLVPKLTEKINSKDCNGWIWDAQRREILIHMKVSSDEVKIKICEE